MDKDVDTFHHLGIISPDMPATVARYEELGFVFTPLSLPEFPLSPNGAPEPVGVGNRNAIFQNGFLEMLGVVDRSRWASISPEQRGPFDIDRPLRRYSGLHVMHFGAKDLDRVHARLTAAGLQPSPIKPFQRMVETPEGSALMRARSLSFVPGSNPEALFQIAQHETPDLALQPRYMSHPNGAFAITEAVLCVEHPDEAADRYARYANCPVEARGPLRVLNLGEARLTVVSPNDLGSILPCETIPTLPFLAGLSVSADLSKAISILRRRQIPFQLFDQRVVVSARDACGSAVIFERPGAER